MSGMLDAKKKPTKNGAAQREKVVFFLDGHLRCFFSAVSFFFVFTKKRCVSLNLGTKIDRSIWSFTG